MAVEFHDFSIEVKGAIQDKIIAALHGAAGELTSQVERNSRVKSGRTKNAWKYVVDEGKHEATIGNPLENAIWEEFGTGEYALEGKGRKGYWVYVDDRKKDKTYDKKPQKTYTYQQALAIYKHLKKKGLDAHITKGKRPQRALYKAFNDNKNKIIRLIEEIMKEI